MERKFHNFKKLYKKATKYLLLALGMNKDMAISILNLPQNFNSEDLKKAYKKKVFEYHPDRNQSPEANRKLVEINEAFELLNNKSEPEQYDDIPDDIPSADLSYEDIAEMRKEMGRDEFNKKYPGWEGELKREMGLDEYNRIFEGYDPDYNPYDDPEYQRSQEALWDYLENSANDAAYDIFDKARDKKDVNLYSNVDELIEKYYDSTHESKHIKKYKDQFMNLLRDRLGEMILDNLDEFNISLQDVIDFPNYKVIEAYLSNIDNIHQDTLPDQLLGNKEFVRSVISFMAKVKNLEQTEAILNKYKDNPLFLKSILENVNFLYYLKDNSVATNLIKNLLPFTDEQKKIVDRWTRGWA